MRDVDLDAVAAELYGLAPGEFIAARNGSAKRARAEGDRHLAEQIAVLRRPTTAAWLVNQLIREQRDEMETLLDLGRELREVLADLGGAELLELTQQRYRLVSALVLQARALATARGVHVTDEVSQAVRSTLEATLSDPDSAQAVAAGRLSDALSVSGFGTPGAVEQRPRPSSGPPPEATVSDLADRRRQKARHSAEREVAVADKEVRRADAELAEAAASLDSVLQRRGEAAAVTRGLRDQLAKAEAEMEDLAGQEHAAREGRETAKRESLEAAKQLAAAKNRLVLLLDEGGMME